MRLLAWSEASQFGGHERMALALLEGLSVDHQVEVVWCLHPDNTRLRGALPPGTAPHLLPRPRLPDRLIRGVAHELAGAYRAAVGRIRPDVVLSIAGWPTCGTTPSLTATGAPVAVYVPNGPSAGGGIRGRVKRWASGLVLGRADLVLTCAGSVAERLRACTRTPVVVVENFIAGVAPPSLATVNPRPVIALIGRVELAVKGHDVLLAALRADPELAAAAEWQVIGAGPDDAVLAQLLAGSGLAKQVRLRGWVDSAVAFAGVDAVVMPSRLEGAPLVAIEACLRRVPVVGSDLPALEPYVLPELRVTTGDGRALATALRRYLDRRGNPVFIDRIAAQATMAATRHDRDASLATLHQALCGLVRSPCTSPG